MTGFALPEIGSVWEWRPGDPQGHEVVTVLEVTTAPAAVNVRGPSGVRWVPHIDWQVYAVPAPLRGRHR